MRSATHRLSYAPERVPSCLSRRTLHASSSSARSVLSRRTATTTEIPTAERPLPWPRPAVLMLMAHAAKNGGASYTFPLKGGRRPLWWVGARSPAAHGELSIAGPPASARRKAFVHVCSSGGRHLVAQLRHEGLSDETCPRKTAGKRPATSEKRTSVPITRRTRHRGKNWPVLCRSSPINFVCFRVDSIVDVSPSSDRALKPAELVAVSD
jgi:hypothetical protein